MDAKDMTDEKLNYLLLKYEEEVRRRRVEKERIANLKPLLFGTGSRCNKCDRRVWTMPGEDEIIYNLIKKGKAEMGFSGNALCDYCRTCDRTSGKMRKVPLRESQEEIINKLVKKNKDT